MGNYTNKAAGYWSEFAGNLVNPINLYGGSLLGAAAAPFSKTRKLREQAEADEDLWKNLLIPGWAGHNAMKRLGHSIRGPEITEAREGLEDERVEERRTARKKRDGDGDGKVNDGTPEEKAAERLLGRLAPPAAMGEKRALGLTAGGAGLGGLIGLLRSRKNEKARGTGYGAGVGAGTGFGAGLGAAGGGILGMGGGALIAALLAKKGIDEEALLRMTAKGGLLGGGIGALTGAGLGGYGGYRASKALAEDVAGEKGLPWGKNEEEAKEASARGELSLVLLKRAMRAASTP